MGISMSHIPQALFGPQMGGVKASAWGTSEGTRAWAATLSYPHHGASSCPCVLPAGPGRCTSALGLGSSRACARLFLRLPGAEGAVGGHPTGVSWRVLQEQPYRGAQLTSWGEPPLQLGAALRQSCLTREERQLGGHPALSLFTGPREPE